MLKTTRRSFLRQAATVGAVAPLILSSQARAGEDRKLRHAAIGTARRGEQDLDEFVTHPDFEIVALCDVDQNFLEQAAKRFPKARLYRDWRHLLDKEGDRIDSVNVTVPNHMHAPIAMTAMKMGKHVYCQKPLTHSIYESRRLAEEAERRPEVVTQMGVQTHSEGGYLTAMAMIQFGVETHVGRVEGRTTDHYHQFIDACLGNLR